MIWFGDLAFSDSLNFCNFTGSYLIDFLMSNLCGLDMLMVPDVDGLFVAS